MSSPGNPPRQSSSSRIVIPEVDQTQVSWEAMDGEQMATRTRLATTSTETGRGPANCTFSFHAMHSRGNLELSRSADSPKSLDCAPDHIDRSPPRNGQCGAVLCSFHSRRRRRPIGGRSCLLEVRAMLAHPIVSATRLRGAVLGGAGYLPHFDRFADPGQRIRSATGESARAL